MEITSSFFQRSTPHYLTGECVLSLCLGLRTVQTVESFTSSAIMSTTRFLRVQPLRCRSLRTWQTFSGFPQQPAGERKKVEARETTRSSSWAPAGSGCEAQGAGTSAVSGPARASLPGSRRAPLPRQEGGLACTGTLGKGRNCQLPLGTAGLQGVLCVLGETRGADQGLGGPSFFELSFLRVCPRK